MKRKYYSTRKRRRSGRAKLIIIFAAIALVLAAGIYFVINALNAPGGDTPPGETGTQSGGPSASTDPTPTPVPSLSLDLKPTAIQGETDPGTLGFTTSIMDNDQEVASYTRPEAIAFGAGDEYTALEGITTFRGNNYRDMSSWGTATITNETLSLMRTKDTDYIGNWGGSGWTGQPLIVTWPAELREKMTSLYDEFRTKDSFTEVILCSLDGRIYFMDLVTGDKTRDYIEIGAPTKGTASLDPRGYPIIYVGQGLRADGDANYYDNMYMRAFSLIDGRKLMETGYATIDPFAYREWQAYDSSPLLDAETDTLIWPGESGVLYTFKLNSSYDPTTGNVTMDYTPATVKYRYTTPASQSRDTEHNGRWGIEDSAVAWRNYLMFTDNAGLLQCVNLNTMELVYANDLGNDSDVTMVLEEIPTEQKVYLYTGCEYDDDVANVEPGSGPCYAYKIDGMTGKVLWKVPFMADSSDKNVDGGILSAPILGREGTTLEGLVIYTVTKLVEDDTVKSLIIALDKETGTLVWEYDMDTVNWSPSSPIAVYSDKTDESGRTIGYIVQCDYTSDIALLRVDGSTCTEVNVLNINEATETESGNNFEATPAIFGNTIVIASRSGHVFFVTIG